MISIFELFIGMAFILVAAMVFCNALEHLGQALGISEGVTGSIFVAVGTALPEAIVPLIALFGGASSAKESAEIGIGAILGPPLMLSTLSIALMAFSVLKSRGLTGLIRPEKTGFKRDLKFFTFGYAVAILLAFSHNFFNSRTIDIFVIMLLIGSYFIYVMLTMKASKNLVKEGHATEAEEELLLKKYLKLPNNFITVVLQALMGFIGLIYFAHIFIDGIIGTSVMFAIPAFLLSVVLIPVATELPEKVNSILWIRRGKDTLALANITGAMVFQGLLLPVIGILLTPWSLPLEKSISCVVTFIATGWLMYNISGKSVLRVQQFIFNGALYLISLIISLILYHG